MKKFILLIIVLILITGGIAALSLNTIVKAGVEKVAPTITKTAVTLGSADISLFSGSGSLNNLLIGSPNGFRSEYVFSLKDISIVLDKESLLSDTIIINEISINSPDIVYEISANGTNVGQILKNAQQASNQKATAQSSGDTTNSASKKKVVINTLKIKGGKVTMSASLLNSGAGASVPLPDIILKDIGKDSGGTNFEAAAAKIIGAVSKKVVSMGINPSQFKDAADGAAQDAIEGVADKLKGFFN